MLTTAALIVLAVGIVASGVFVANRVLGAVRRYRGKMLVTCPENQERVAVEVDSGHVASSALRGAPDLELKACTRWPERADCGQSCLTQVADSPEGCLVRTMLRDWYQRQACAYCGKGFDNVDSYDHKAAFFYDKKPALLGPANDIVEWRDVAVEKLPDVLTTHRAVCWDCLIAQTMCRDHPDLVLKRPLPPRKLPS